MKTIIDGQDFFYYDEEVIKLGTAAYCDDCGQLCAVNDMTVVSGDVPYVYCGSVLDIWAAEDGSAICSVCWYKRENGQ